MGLRCERTCCALDPASLAELVEGSCTDLGPPLNLHTKSHRDRGPLALDGALMLQELGTGINDKRCWACSSAHCDVVYLKVGNRRARDQTAGLYIAFPIPVVLETTACFFCLL